MTINKLMAPDLGFYLEDSVVFRAELTVYNDQTACRSSMTLTSCLKTMMLKGQDSDINIVIGTDSTTHLPAHRCILTARSPVFRAMLSFPMKESTTGLVVIEDIDLSTMQEVLHYIYTDSLSDCNKLSLMAESLFCAATKYEIVGLMSLCEEYLIQQITLETSIRFLRLGDMYNGKRLKHFALAFITHHYLAVIETKGNFELDRNLYVEVRMSVFKSSIGARHSDTSFEFGTRKVATCVTTSKVKAMTGSFAYRFERYGRFNTRIGDSTISPKFELYGHLWQFRIFPGGSFDSEKEYLSLYLESNSNRVAKASCELFVVNQMGGNDEMFSGGVRRFQANGDGE